MNPWWQRFAWTVFSVNCILGLTGWLPGFVFCLLFAYIWVIRDKKRRGV